LQLVQDMRDFRPKDQATRQRTTQLGWRYCVTEALGASFLG
jgi:hypothetical protein